MTGDEAYVIAMNGVRGCASGYDRAVRTGDNTFTIFFKNGDSVDLTIALPKDGKDGKDGTDGIDIVDVKIDSNSHLIVTLSSGQKVDAGAFENNAVLADQLKATVSIGSVSTGKIYPKNTKLEAIIRDMLIKEVAPSVVLALTPSTVLYDVVSDTVDSIKLTATITKGTYAPKSIKFYAGTTLLFEEVVGSNMNLSYTYTPATPIKDNTDFKVVVVDEKGLNGSATKSIKFVAQSYYGTVADTVSDPDEAIIKALANKTLKEVKKLVYSGINMEYGKVVYAYPKSFGDLTSIMDKKNNLNYTATYTKTTATVDGIAYNVYTKNNPSKAVDVELTFE